MFFHLLSFLEGRTRTQLLGDLWDAQPTAATLNHLRVTLHRVRAALGWPGAVTESGRRYQLAPELYTSSDVQALHGALQDARQARAPAAAHQSYERGQAACQGEYLPQVRADRVRLPREAHHTAHLRLCLEQSQRHCNAGACAPAMAALERALRADPYLGEHHQKLMTCLSVVAGPFVDTEHYRRLLRFLNHDLNDAPLPQTVALARRVKAGERLCARGVPESELASPGCSLRPDGRCPWARPTLA